MAIEIVDLPTIDGDFPVRYVKLPEGSYNPPSNMGMDQYLYHIFRGMNIHKSQLF